MTGWLKQKIIAHLWMWAIILGGMWVALRSLPPVSVFSLKSDLTKTLLLVIAAMAFYELARGLVVRLRTPLTPKGLRWIISRGDYGKCVHPTCTLSVLVLWGAFLLFPDLRLFAAAIWTSAVVYVWIKLEEEVVVAKPGHYDASADMTP
jgi:hypothetical protein